MLKSFFLPELIWLKSETMFRFTVLKVPISSIGRSSNLIDLLEYSLESFKVFHCSVIKVLCFVVISDNFYIVSDV